jgi:hypothetical protein
MQQKMQKYNFKIKKDHDLNTLTDLNINSTFAIEVFDSDRLSFMKITNLLEALKHVIRILNFHDYFILKNFAQPLQTI